LLALTSDRFHNHVVEQLAEINENGRFTKPSPDLPEDKAKAAWEKYDEDLFQTGRLYVSTPPMLTATYLTLGKDHLWSVHQHHPVRLPAYHRQLEQSEQHLVPCK
jgi:hypothetical protein